MPSLPSRERGLKFVYPVFPDLFYLSLPSRERGLKSIILYDEFLALSVAPFAGAWIEINQPSICCAGACRRSLRGSVD